MTGNIKRRQILAALVIGLLTGITSTGLAASYYVSSTGNDSSNGTSWASAWLTIGKAGSTATNFGDNIIVSNGTYSLSGKVTLQPGVTCRSTNGYSVTTIQGGSFQSFELMTNATLRGFAITGGTYNPNGVILMRNDSTLDSCHVYGNAGSFGALFTYDALVRNCLVTGNNGQYAGGIYMQASVAGPGTLESCTIYGNTATAGGNTYSGGVVFRNTKGIARNCIIYGNTDSGGGRQDWGGTPTLFEYSCTSLDPSAYGVSNITADPALENPGGGDYSLQSASPCVDAGTNQGWMVSATDLAGTNRVFNGVDMGCLEWYAGTAFDIAFVADDIGGTAPHQAVFTATVTGTNTSGLYYWWDFDNNGSVDQEGAGKAVVTNAYATPGLYTIVATVSNDAMEVAVHTNDDYITVAPITVYLSGSGGDQYPYTNWQDAATAVLDAVNASDSGTTILVADGTYTISQNVNLSSGITLASANGYEVTALRGSGGTFQMFVVESNAVIDGFTIKNGNYNSVGVIKLLNSSTLKNCRLMGNFGTFGTVYMFDALVRNCLFTGNNGQYAGGIYMQASGAGPGTLESCTIYGNTATAGGNTYAGGVVFRNSKGIARNCIVYGNTDSGGGRQNWGGSATLFDYSCTTPDSGDGGIVTNNPLFEDVAAANYQLLVASACKDSGTNLAWVLAGGATDLACDDRLRYGTVDMGAFEYRAAQGTIITIR